MKQIEIRLVREWDNEAIRHLYRIGGWWKEEWDLKGIRQVISGSLAFAVGIDHETGETVAMGRVISDGVADAYIQDVVVVQEYRRLGVGRRLMTALISACEIRGITWIGLIAEPGTEKFYTPAGFTRMEGYIPMIFSGAGKGGDGDIIEE
ncbi:MAG TPA: GNAT family N-acetyltransferase [Methanoregulaceae archaeon]|nr:GNAT family N-acetyltransferase [Methanoregulaceae archaeon]